METYDAVIVGSGFGGSITACRLAEASHSVCVLKRGKSYPPNSFARTPYEFARNFWDPEAGHFGLLNVWSFDHSRNVVIVAARASPAVAITSSMAVATSDACMDTPRLGMQGPQRSLPAGPSGACGNPTPTAVEQRILAGLGADGNADRTFC